MLNSDTFWGNLHRFNAVSEADVETRLILPLLEALGYAPEDISAKAGIVFQTGRKGRNHEADFIVHEGGPRTKRNSLLVIEAKKPGENATEAKLQAESYAQASGAPFLLITDGQEFSLWQIQLFSESTEVLNVAVEDLHKHRGQIELLLSRDAAIAHCQSLGLRPVSAIVGDIVAYTSASATTLGAATIERRLTALLDRKEVTSSNLFEHLEPECFIEAASGLGKTCLAKFLFRLSLAQLQECAPVPFLGPKPNQSIECDIFF